LSASSARAYIIGVILVAVLSEGVTSAFAPSFAIVAVLLHRPGQRSHLFRK
jgi:hypothetical protein